MCGYGIGVALGKGFKNIGEAAGSLYQARLSVLFRGMTPSTGLASGCVSPRIGSTITEHTYDNGSTEVASTPPTLTSADDPRAPLTLALFGRLQIRLDGRDVAEPLPGRQGRALVAFLVLNEDRPVSRDELLDVLWPSQPPADPQAALSSLLAKVRRVLGADLIQGRQALVLQLPPDSYVDAHAVGEQIQRAERALASRDPAAALQATQTVLEVLDLPLLPDLDGEWIEPWRRRFDELMPRVLEIAAGANLGLGEIHLPAAERAACDLVAREPYREAGYALLMQAQARQGNVAEALRTFDQVRVLLRDELGTHPSPSLMALHESLLREHVPDGRPAALAVTQPRAHASPTVTSQMIEGAFVGRDEFSQRLRTRWEETRAGQTRLVLLVGEPGVGKTRLAAEFAEEVHAGGGTVLYGRADEEALLPHQPFVEALRQLVTSGDAAVTAAAEQDRDILWRLLPDLAPPVAFDDGHREDDALRYRLFEAVTSLLCTASQRSPLLLILDDLHWADKATLLLLRHLLRHPRLTDLLVVGTFRHVEVGRDHPLVDLLTDLRRERRYDRLTLPGLDDAATAALVADRLQRPVHPEFIRRLREQTEGNVFFIEETIRALIDSGLSADETVTELDLERLGVPEGVSEIVGRRISHLSEQAAEVLTAASVVGRDFRLGIVAEIVGAPSEQVMCALEESMAAGLVIENTARIDVFAFSHALVREVLYGQLSVSRRVRLHHCVAEALEGVAESESINPAELAHHFLLARHFTGPGPARKYTIAAGNRATELLAYEEAVEHYKHAVTLFPDDQEAERCEVLLALARAQWRAGDDAARGTSQAVAASATLREDAGQLARAALSYSARYHESALAGAHGRELLEQALAAIGSTDSVRRVLLLSSLAGTIAFAAQQREQPSELSAEAVAMARRLGNEEVLLAALMARHATLLHVRHLDERLMLSEECMGLRVSRSELVAEGYLWRLYDLLESANVEAARAEQPRLEALAARMRQPQWNSITVGWRGMWAELAGDVAEAERCAEECLQHGQRAGMKHALSTWASTLFMLRRRQGRLGELAPAVERLARAADMRTTGWPSAFGLILADTGDEDAARVIYREELAGHRHAPPLFWLTKMAMLSELCVRLHDREGARALYAALAPYAHRNIVVAYGSCWGPVERYLALLAGTFDDDELRRQHARSALARTRMMNAPLLAGELQEHHDDLLTT
jgi:DNA-binding SARP family transcriptional activator/KaiC/GvpD/RAD55 family RecA-like ATPase